MAWIAGLAVVALGLAGWRKNARARPKTPRSLTDVPRRVPYQVRTVPAPPYKPAGPLRRLWAVIASAGLVVIVGAVLATITAFGLAVVVTTMTDLLRR